jgi:ClpX C4-type zinc finger
VEEASDQPGGNGYVYALTDEEAYLQTDDDEKPAITQGPPPDPAWFRCWFCRKSHPQVQRLFGAEYPVRDPNNFANETLVCICNECVAKFAGWFARESSGASS